ncbi:MAG: PD-(D/E)XK nuclease family protein, partial [Oceanihabitans sp.]
FEPLFKTTYNSYLKANNQWEENKKSYAFGNPLKKLKDKGTTKKLLKQDTFISTSKESHNIKIVTKSGCLWNTDQEKAIEKGNLVHDIMSQINTKEDISFAIGNFLEKDIINQKQAESLKATIIQIVEHSELKKYFSLKNTIYNERDILSKNNSIIRPDRLVINSKNEAVIIDYKTGNPSQKHKNQLENYKTVIEEMPIQVSKKILVYINEEIKVQTF